MLERPLNILVILQGKEQASTKVALAVAQIQRVLPRARVVYCSATGVADVKNMVRLYPVVMATSPATYWCFHTGVWSTYHLEKKNPLCHVKSTHLKI